MGIFGGGGSGNGAFSYPNIGVAVWCFFENGDQNLPVYFAVSLGGDVASDSPAKGFEAVRENATEDEDKKEDTTMTGKDAQQHGFMVGDGMILFRESGQIEIKAKESRSEKESSGEGSGGNEDGQEKNEATIKVTKDGLVEINASRSITLNSPTILINGSSVQINGDQMKLYSSAEGCIQARDVLVIGQNSFTGASPAINMDATSGKFIAKGASGTPLFVT